MPEPDLDLARYRRVHVIGAGGAGMSAIATVLLALGRRVTGSDASDSPALLHLADLGADVHAGHDPSWVEGSDPGQDLVVRSTAIPDDNIEVLAARAAGLNVWRRADVLAAIARLRRTVAVSGTHGKTTTSSMVAITMQGLGWRPSLIVGGDIAGIGGGAVWDEGPWFVVEADESDGTFVRLGAEAVIVTSVEADHLEYYGGMAGLEDAFRRFVGDAPGPAVLCADDPGAARLAEARPADRPAVTYGLDPAADYVVGDPVLERGGARFWLTGPDGRAGRVTLAVPGLHNVRNAAAAVAVATELGAEWPAVLDAVGRYGGVGRRFEGRGEKGGVSFVDGYDHLPTEVAAAIATARTGGWNRVVVVFQPHRYSRTEALGTDFGPAFAGADVLVVTDVYAAGETPRPGVTGRVVFDAARRANPSVRAHYVADLDEAEVLLPQLLQPGDVCLTLGAGDITTLPDRVQARMERP